MEHSRRDRRHFRRCESYERLRRTSSIHQCTESWGNPSCGHPGELCWWPRPLQNTRCWCGKLPGRWRFRAWESRRFWWRPLRAAFQPHGKLSRTCRPYRQQESRLCLWRHRRAPLMRLHSPSCALCGSKQTPHSICRRLKLRAWHHRHRARQWSSFSTQKCSPWSISRRPVRRTSCRRECQRNPEKIKS